MRRALLIALVACGNTKTAPNPEVTGTLSLDGKPLVVTQCHAGRGVTTYVEVVTGQGKLRFEDKQLFWSKTDFGKGDKLDCPKLDRSWGGGLRKDGSSYFRGHLIFQCTTPVVLAGDLTVDCGHITPEERAQLDKNRSDMLAEQAGDRCAEVQQRAEALQLYPKAIALQACRDDKWPADAQACAIAATDVTTWNACLSADQHATLARLLR